VTHIFFCEQTFDRKTNNNPTSIIRSRNAIVLIARHIRNHGVLSCAPGINSRTSDADGRVHVVDKSTLRLAVRFTGFSASLLTVLAPVGSCWLCEDRGWLLLIRRVVCAAWLCEARPWSILKYRRQRHLPRGVKSRAIVFGDTGRAILPGEPIGLFCASALSGTVGNEGEELAFFFAMRRALLDCCCRPKTHRTADITPSGCAATADHGLLSEVSLTSRKNRLCAKGLVAR